MKRYREFVILGLFTLLLAASEAFTSDSAAGIDAAGFGSSGRHQSAASNTASQELLLRNADLYAPNLSRIDHSSPYGIAPQPIATGDLNAHGLGFAGILPISSREIGFHALLRAPPSFLLI